MADVIGRADDFYRLRVIHMDESEAPDLDWRDDILYRRPSADSPEEYDVWRVEAIDVDDEERAVTLATFDSVDDAHEWFESLEADLAVMTRSEFEQTYFPGDEDGPREGLR